VNVGVEMSRQRRHCRSRAKPGSCPGAPAFAPDGRRRRCGARHLRCHDRTGV